MSRTREAHPPAVPQGVEPVATGVHQTRFGKPHGNCYQAALATVLGVPLAEVPDFDGGDGWTEYCEMIREWLNERGFAMYAFGICRDGVPWCVAPEGAQVLALGPSPRGDFDHIVVSRFKDGVLCWEHDPHPSGEMVQKVTSVEFLVPTHSQALAAARAEEREACASLASRRAKRHRNLFGWLKGDEEEAHERADECESLAAAIRGQTERGKG